MKATPLPALIAALLLGSATSQAALLAHWTFDEAGDVDAADSSGNGYDLSRNSGSTVTGKAGNAYSAPRFALDASDSLAVKNGGGSVITLSAWVTTTPSGGFQGIAGFENTGSGQDVYSLKYDGSNIVWTMDGSSLITSASTLATYAAANPDGWVHLVGVYEQGVGSILYANGAVAATGGAANAIQTDVSTFAVGSYQGGTSYAFGGRIDDVQVYNEALSASQVSFLYSNPGTAIPEPSAVLLGGLGALLLLRRRRCVE